MRRKADSRRADKASPEHNAQKAHFSQLYQLTKPLFVSSNVRKAARAWAVVLISLSFAVAGVQVLMSYVGRDFMTAIANKDRDGFWHNFLLYLGSFAIAVPIGVYYRYVEHRLALLWRRWLTQHLTMRYFSNRAYYKLRGVGGLDNPDQRITEDVRNFTTHSLTFFLILLNSTVTLVAFTGVVWSISPKLVAVLFGYAFVGTAMSILIGRRLVRLQYEQYQREADLRYSLVRVRDNAESIAFYRGEKRENRDVMARLSSVVENTLRIIAWVRNLGIFSTTYNYAALVLPAIVVAPMFMRGEVEFGVVTQSAVVFAQVLAALSMVITQFEGLSQYAAGVARLGNLWNSLDEHDAEEAREAEDPSIDVEEARKLRLEALTVKTPDGEKTLVSDLDLELKSGDSVLVMGESGSGKSSLLRTIAGLWQSGEGSIARPALKNIMFLPQRPYMVPGTLRDQFLYPAASGNEKDEDLEEVVERVRLGDVLERVDGNLDAAVDWANVLSLGEQQRVSFARLFLHKPLIAFLDEATSALDEANEKHLYAELKRSGISFISVGHRSTLKKFHRWLLQLGRGGATELGPTDARKAKKG